MNTPSTIVFLSLVLTGEILAEDARMRAAPQPRVRLDPVSHLAVVMPVTEAAPEARAPVVVMDKFVVKEQGIPKEPSHPPEQRGGFSPQEGGYILRGGEKVVWEIGAWAWLPWTDVMTADLVKFPKPRTRVDFDFVRIHW